MDSVSTIFPEHAEHVARLFYEFGKDPKHNKSLAEYLVDSLKEYPVSMVEKVINEAIGVYDTLPRAKALRSIAVSIRKSSSTNFSAVECDKCGGDGTVLGLFKVLGKDRQLLVYYPTDVEPGTRFYTAIIGACSCDNGKRYISFADADWQGFIKSYDSKLPYNNVVANICIKLNKGYRDDNETVSRLPLHQQLRDILHERRSEEDADG
jgi:hypothetical protein